MAIKSSLDADLFLAAIAREGTTVHYSKGSLLFSQGDPADVLFSVLKGKVKLIGGHGGNYALAGEFLHEQISQTRLHRI